MPTEPNEIIQNDPPLDKSTLTSALDELDKNYKSLQCNIL